MKLNKLIISLMVLAAVFSSSAYAVTVKNDISSRITSAIIRYLVSKDASYEGKRIEVEYKYADKTFNSLKGRSGTVTFVVAELYPDFKPIGNIIIPIQVVVDGEPKEKLFIRTKVSVYDNIVIATKRLKRGDIIGTTEAAVQVRDIATLNSQAIKDINIVLGKEAKTFIPMDNPIYEYMIKEKPLIKKNDAVTIKAFNDDISVEADGIALEDGLMGAQIRVRNSRSGKEVIAVITGTGEVTVK